MQKSINNLKKARLGRVPGALGDGLGVILAPMAAQGAKPAFFGPLLVMGLHFGAHLC